MQSESFKLDSIQSMTHHDAQKETRWRVNQST